MRILAISHYSHPVVYRPEAEIFIGLKKMGADIRVFSLPNSPWTERFKSEGIETLEKHPVKKFDREFITFLREYIVTENIDVIHLFNSKATINGLVAARGTKAKIALYRGYEGNIHWYDPSAYLKYLHPRVDKIFCIAGAVEELIRKNLFRNKDKVITIRKGHNPEWYVDVKSKDVRKEFGFPQDSTVFCCVANARPMKGIHYLAGAFQYIKNTNAYLVFIGEGLLDQQVQTVIDALPEEAKKRIVFSGYRKDALQLVKGSDSFVLSSLYGEAITKSVIEAMNLGTAPIITDIPGNVDLVVDGESGLVVEKANSEVLAKAMDRYTTDDAFRNRMAEGAKDRMQNFFHIDRSIELYYKAYESMLK
jgi:glycosyltransferase involved in cell wall biosynthesis